MERVRMELYMSIQKMVGMQSQRLCLYQICKHNYPITGVFKVIALVTLGITILANEKAYSQSTYRNDIYLSIEDYCVKSHFDDSLIILVLTDSIASRMQVEKDVRIHLRDETGRVVIAGRMGVFDAAFPSGCNYYFNGNNRDICLRKNKYVLKQIPKEYQRDLFHW